jgi:ribonuclease HI
MNRETPEGESGTAASAGRPGGRLIIYTDGASRGNPGPSSIGGSIQDSEGREVHTISKRIGRATNNEAEYQAVIAALEAALGLGGEEVELRTDSELLERQLNGRYRVKNPRLIPLNNRVKALRDRFAKVRIVHVRRELNRRADALANLALDRPA